MKKTHKITLEVLGFPKDAIEIHLYNATDAEAARYVERLRHGYVDVKAVALQERAL